jgi:hypothetical protein
MSSPRDRLLTYVTMLLDMRPSFLHAPCRRVCQVTAIRKR